MNIQFIEYNGISGYARVMYNDVKDADKYHIEVAYEGKDIKALLEYLFELEEENKRLNNNIEEIKDYINIYPVNACHKLLEILDKENK